MKFNQGKCPNVINVIEIFSLTIISIFCQPYTVQSSLATPGVELLQVVAARGWIVLSFLQEVGVTRVSRLPQQVLLVSSLSEARIPQSGDVDILHFSLQLLQVPGEVRTEAVLDVVADLHIWSSSLNVVFMSWLEAVQWVAHLNRNNS